jgi:hypothetical protein
MTDVTTTRAQAPAGMPTAVASLRKPAERAQAVKREPAAKDGPRGTLTQRASAGEMNDYLGTPNPAAWRQCRLTRADDRARSLPGQGPTRERIAAGRKNTGHAAVTEQASTAFTGRVTKRREVLCAARADLTATSHFQG